MFINRLIFGVSEATGKGITDPDWTRLDMPTRHLICTLLESFEHSKLTSSGAQRGRSEASTLLSFLKLDVWLQNPREYAFQDAIREREHNITIIYKRLKAYISSRRNHISQYPALPFFRPLYHNNQW